MEIDAAAAGDEADIGHAEVFLWIFSRALVLIFCMAGRPVLHNVVRWVMTLVRSNMLAHVVCLLPRLDSSFLCCRRLSVPHAVQTFMTHGFGGSYGRLKVQHAWFIAWDSMVFIVITNGGVMELATWFLHQNHTLFRAR